MCIYTCVHTNIDDVKPSVNPMIRGMDLLRDYQKYMDFKKFMEQYKGYQAGMRLRL